MKIQGACRRRMIERARADAPNETCGFFSGMDGCIADIHPMKNVSDDPEIRYEFEPVEHFKMLKRSEKENVPILGVYHSHPASPAYPSATDVARAMLPDGTPTYPEYVYVILSLQFPDHPVLRAFRILQGGGLQEEDLSIVDPVP